MFVKKLVSFVLGGGAVVAAIAALTLPGTHERLDAAVLIPPPATNVIVTQGNQVAVFAGGCFWGMEAVFQHVSGVRSVTAGYAGGSAETAHYNQVGTGRTGHAEAVRIVYDPSVVTYGQLLRIYFSVAHDPTQVNRQGPDVGSDYRSAIFPRNVAQRSVARRYIALLNVSGRFARPIATQIENGTFYRAEDYHQNFMNRNPRHPYILAHDVEKVEDLRATFPRMFTATPAA
ncbi:peptide-methionine (S)-S-oxide reductase MsrA [Parasphingopyxis lamellibrachiae]|uniref:Peptide methionine sulfoxide reductase MsrA n=1 Tax=Parasphingopyxis lamellibrachiae TaxID=680125 RepID=A0A3D9FK27_9SPHN|nr:peptide-methionine (S)-S-oxide reductase MsrA [Parasphingopyxis lamellibrachiae]RED17446.1 peptide-methionine (S)-S-oxide reductase [Parasphingopyxis lamellibrachiae]